MRHQLARISWSRSFQNNNWTLFLNLYWHAKATMLTSKMIHQFRKSICFVHVFVKIYQWCTWHLIYLKYFKTSSPKRKWKSQTATNRPRASILVFESFSLLHCFKGSRILKIWQCTDFTASNRQVQRVAQNDFSLMHFPNLLLLAKLFKIAWSRRFIPKLFDFSLFVNRISLKKTINENTKASNALTKYISKQSLVSSTSLC